MTVLVLVTVALSVTDWFDALTTTTLFAVVVVVFAGTIRVYAIPPTIAFPALSVAFTLNLYVPVVVGVPLILPLLSMDKPGGSVPLSNAYEYGLVPPLATTV